MSRELELKLNNTTRENLLFILQNELTDEEMKSIILKFNKERQISALENLD